MHVVRFHFRFCRRVSLNACIAALLFALCTSDGAAQDSLTLTVVPGAGGTVRAGAAAPIHAIIRNDGPALTAAVTLNWLSGTQRPAVSDFRLIELPQNSTKKITLYSDPARSTTNVLVTLRRFESGASPQSGAVLAKFSEDIAVLDAETPVLGVIGPPFAGLPAPTDKKGNAWGRHLYFSEELLPEDFRGWEMCDAIVYTPRQGTTPSAAELGALRDWVFQGGDLVIDSSEPNPVFANPGFRGFLPYSPSGQEQRTTELLGTETVHSVGQIGEGEVILREGEIPLTIRRVYGLGSVTQTTFELGGSAFAKSARAESIWREMLPELYFIPPDDWLSFEFSGFDEFTESLLRAVTRTPDVRVQLFVVVLLIGLYALAVGPGDYLLAKRYKRPMLTWVTFPSMVLVFTSAAFLGARTWIGGEQRIVAQRTVTYFPEGALYNEAVGFFASSSRNYHLASANNSPLRVLANSMDNPDRALVDNETGGRTQRIPTWSARVFTSVRRNDDVPPVTFGLEEGDGTYILTITNSSAKTVLAKALSANGRHFAIRPAELHPILPGKSVQRTLKGSRSTENRIETRAGGATEIWDAPMTRAARYRSLDHRPLVERGDYILTCEVAEPDPSVLEIDGQPVSANDTAEWIHIVIRNTNPEPVLRDDEGKAR